MRVCGHKGHSNVIECFPRTGSIETISSFISMGSHNARPRAYFGRLVPLNLTSSCRTNLRGTKPGGFPMKYLITSAIAVVAVLTTATTMLSSYSPSTERHATGTVIGHCKNFHSLTGTKASELLPY